MFCHDFVDSVFNLLVHDPFLCPHGNGLGPPRLTTSFLPMSRSSYLVSGFSGYRKYHLFLSTLIATVLTLLSHPLSRVPALSVTSRSAEKFCRTSSVTPLQVPVVLCESLHSRLRQLPEGASVALEPGDAVLQ